MKLIAHRGNINGINEDKENLPEYILEAINLKYDCEIDIRLIDTVLYLGHDTPNYQIDINFLLNNSMKLWIHCKNYEAFGYLIQYKELNIFWHQSDSYTLTSKGYIWCYPDQIPPNKTISIILMPEINNFNSLKHNMDCYGICSDYVKTIENTMY
jgi:hypothetical protein